ncbi:MAG: lysophospholipid acyltransferase family protein [Melioribacteraceae bacterium]|nr:lysophospholipid acyltransferase family protein [Melioribacteraceae bacterium]MCF8356452.1 lysophospholipid acyltransferase family protein [Melioribacteraceae bacterium]MCF8395840.1 lysophospholipid acyltransferase family protein [Melioribacteraceae bacterium]MCF8420924.1 lysophospholipid acyltransferase family protein [Melioribacteraceae bacterium]
MNKINLDKLISDRYPDFNNKPKILRNFSKWLLAKTLHIKEINSFIERNFDKQGLAFIDEIFEDINFSFTIPNKDIKRIPAEGRLICVSNHPIGSLDGLALLRAISEVRHDVKIVANDILTEIKNLESYFLPFNLENNFAQRKNILSISSALENEEAVIIFPAAEVSRLKFLKVMDSRWNKGSIYFSKKHKVPILPIHIKARNSVLFYFSSIINKNLSRFLLPHELYNKKNMVVSIRIGDPIPYKAFEESFINDKEKIKLLKKHVYLLRKKKKGVYLTEKNIIHPINRKLIKKELLEGKQLGLTSDNKKIILIESDSAVNVMMEIARLREVTFRKVGEGTGMKLDLDEYDKYYKHLIVWDENELEIVGSYRIGIGEDILNPTWQIGGISCVKTTT